MRTRDMDLDKACCHNAPRCDCHDPTPEQYPCARCEEEPVDRRGDLCAACDPHGGDWHDEFESEVDRGR